MSETKHKIKVDNVEYVADGIWWEYPQTDGDGAGASSENIMYRDVLPERMKFGIKIISPSEEQVSSLLTMCKKKEAMVEFFDIRDQKRVTRKMYITCDQVNATLLKNGEFYCEDFEIRFIQMVPDEYME